jgi:hypothetical protein
MYGDEVERANKAARPAPSVLRTEAGEAADTCAARQSARNALLMRAMHLHEEARQLEGLARAIPENFPADAEAALWRLAVSLR